MDTVHAQRVLGLISGSSLDGINAAIITTDGVDVFEFGEAREIPYDDELRDKLRWFHHNYTSAEEAQKQELENLLTQAHATAIRDIIDSDDKQIDLVGFHGHTIVHKPDEHFIYHIGNAQQLADSIGIKVVSRFRQADILSGGQGAPLSAVYHQALASAIEKPVAFVDIGGISSLTWMGSNGELLAFDAGPGNNAINDWVFKHAGQHMDYNGKQAALGTVHMPIINQLMRHKFLAKHPPKAADKATFKDKLEHLEGLSLQDGAATATSFVAEAIAYSIALYLPEAPKTLIICGGGAQNPTLVRFLRQRFDSTVVKTASELGWDASAIEAQAFAYLAARRVNLMPATYPFTTGVSMPCICGEVFEPK
ncbi:MAG: anhydro-N-acetylmuramic acid kinase [Alphaproteobacteria bacterium]|nr:anhydro-N-acetylmuramic acid kinase [Alphaproteobacteria bacterium]